MAAEDTASRLARAFEAIVAEARRNPTLAKQVEAALAAEKPPEPPPRARAVLDPFDIYEKGWEVMLRERLAALDLEKLKDVIAQYEMDPSGGAMQQGQRGPLIDLIAAAVEKAG